MDGAVPMLNNELAVIARAKAEPDAFTALYDHYFPRIYSYVRYRVPDAAAAADVTSQVFEQAYRHLASYDPARAAFSTWLFTIARNALYNHTRGQKLRRWLSLDHVIGKPDHAPPPEAAVIHQEAHADLLEAVARLPERERDILALKFGAALTNRRIADLTGLTENNVAVILYRAVRRLRAELEVEVEA